MQGALRRQCPDLAKKRNAAVDAGTASRRALPTRPVASLRPLTMGLAIPCGTRLPTDRVGNAQMQGICETGTLDMRELDRVLNLDIDRRRLTVQAGSTWREIQEYIDPYNLAVKIIADIRELHGRRLTQRQCSWALYRRRSPGSLS